MIELKIQNSDNEGFLINNEVAKELEVVEGDILLAQNPINQKTLVGKVEIGEIGEDKIGIQKVSYEALGMDENFDIQLETYDKEVKSLQNVDFGIEEIGSSEEDPLSTVKENEKKFEEFIKKKYCTKDSAFKWKDHDLIITLGNTKPSLENNEVGKLSGLEDFSYSWGGSELKSFDGILLVDLSGSMEKRDLSIKGVDWVIDRINNSIEGDYTSQFLGKLKDKPKIKRADGATLCSLVYLVQKVGRGIGDKISIIPFSDSATTINFENKKFFSSAVTDTEGASESIIEGVRYHPKGRTNISEGIDRAIETIKNFERGKMKMIVLLTDGKPHPPSLDTSENVLDMVDKRLKPRKDVIVNTIGLGDEVDHHLLDEIAKRTGGEYTYVNSLQGLTQAYSRYATKISIKNTL